MISMLVDHQLINACFHLITDRQSLVVHGQIVIAKHLDNVLDASSSVRVHGYLNDMTEARVNDSLKRS